MPDETPNPLDRIAISELKDHEFREMVNDMTKIARVFGNTQQLRCRMAGVLVACLRPYRDVEKRAGDGAHFVDVEYLLEDDPVFKQIHHEKRVTRLSEEDIDQIARTSDDADTENMLQLLEDLHSCKTNGAQLAAVARYRKQTRIDAINNAVAKLRK